MERKKIVFVIDSLTFGGRERVVIDLANAVDREKFKVVVLTLANDKNECLESLNSDVELYQLPFSLERLGGLGSIYFWLKGIPLFISFLRKVKPDIIHTHLFFQRLFFVAVGFKLSSINAIFFQTVHTIGLYYSSNRFVDKFRIRIEKWAIKLANANVIGISELVHENNKLFFNKYAKELKCINNGINVNYFSKLNFTKVSKRELGLPTDVVLVVYVARLDHGKNHLQLLQQWKKIDQQHQNVHLCLVGDGIVCSLVKEYVERNGLENSVTLLGAISNVAEVLSVCDIAVFPSEFEGFSLALLEKMSMGLPAVVSNIPAFVFLIEHGVTGFLFDLKDFDGLSYYLNRLINDDDLRFRMGEASRNYAMKFSFSNTIKSHEEFYSKCSLPV